MEQTRVVVIGGGAVGVSVLYHLALAGWTDCVLLERNELTAGSTWHAAGNCPTFAGSWGVMAMQRESMRLYRKLKDHPDRPITYNVTGTLRLAHSKARMQEFERAAGMALAQGEPYELLTPSEARDRHPFLETHDLEGVLWDAVDGDIDPASLTQALAGHAREMGAKIHRFRPATGVRREGGDWIVETATGDIRAEYVVNAAGYYAQRVGEWFRPHGGRTVPMAVMSHQYLLTEEIPEIAAWTAAHGRKLPMIRDVDTSYYLRQEKAGLNLGPYERDCRAHWVTPDDPMPDDFSFQLWPDDLDRLEWHIEDAMARVPLLGRAGISKVINGPIPYTPDGLPLIGPMPGVLNAFEACVFTFGIAQAGGAGKLLAGWITEGRPAWDAWSLDPRRFTAHASDPDYALARAKEVYGHEYAMHFPRKHWPEGRGLKLSPVHADLAARGAVWGCYNGWERALWFARPGDDISLEATERWDRDGPWEARVRAECHAVRDAVGVLDLPGFSRFRIEGPGAADWLSAQITGAVPPPGRIGLGYFADKDGRIVTEMSVVRLGEDAFWLITAASAQWHDREWIERTLPDSLTLTDETADWSTHLLTGPNSRALLGGIAEGFDPAKPWLSWQTVRIAGAEARLLRVSFAGELGWEIHGRVADTPAIWTALWQAGSGHGLRPFGMLALDSLRIEKGYRAWKQDLSTDYSVLAAGLGRFIRWDHDFPGKRALENERQQGSARSFAALTVQANGIDAPHMANVWHGDTLVGETTSGAFGHRTDRSIALSMIRSDLAVPGTGLEVEIFGARYPATVQEGAHYDPANERLRA